MKRSLPPILSAVTLFAATASADLLDRYENGYEHVIGHASRAATAVRDNVT